jgi:hypothetical protein
MARELDDDVPGGDADDDMFEPGSEANHEALELLGELLVDVGFRVRKKARKEATLRVYLEGRDHPLLNPRFEPSGDAWGLPDFDECVVFTAWMEQVPDGLRERLQQAAVGFEFIGGEGSSDADQELLGWFVVLMGFDEDDDEVRFDLALLEESLRSLHAVLEQHF